LADIEKKINAYYPLIRGQVKTWEWWWIWGFGALL